MKRAGASKLLLLLIFIYTTQLPSLTMLLEKVLEIVLIKLDDEIRFCTLAVRNTSKKGFEIFDKLDNFRLEVQLCIVMRSSSDNFIQKLLFFFQNNAEFGRVIYSRSLPHFIFNNTLPRVLIS